MAPRGWPHGHGTAARRACDALNMTEDDFKGGVHAVMGSILAVVAAYNAMCWCNTRSARHAINRRALRATLDLRGLPGVGGTGGSPLD